MTATYPDDATISSTAFSIVADVTYTNTTTTTVFNLPSIVSHIGEVVTFAEGISQLSNSYSLSNGGATLDFFTAPNAANLTLKTLSLPSRYTAVRKFPQLLVEDYSNVVSVVNGNTYSTNGVMETFSLPDGATTGRKEDLMVFVSGVQQNQGSYDYPAVNAAITSTSSRDLGYQGITIGEKDGTKLLLNFNGADAAVTTTDNSWQGTTHTIGFHGNAALATASKKYGLSSLVLDGTGDFVSMADSADFVYSAPFNLQMYASFDATGTAEALYYHGTDGNNYTLLEKAANDSIMYTVVESGAEVINIQNTAVAAGAYNHYEVTNDGTNIYLFVNGALGQTQVGSIGLAPTGNVSIGTQAESSKYMNGNIDSLRYVASKAIHTEAFIPPVHAFTNYNEPLSDQDTLTIRVINPGAETVDRITSMIDRKPDKGYSGGQMFDVISQVSEAGYEKTRLRSRRVKRDYTLKYTNVTGIEKTAIEDFFKARYGSFETFLLDLTHLNETGTMSVKFDGALSISQVFSGGPEKINNFYTISFKLKEAYD